MSDQKRREYNAAIIEGLRKLNQAYWYEYNQNNSGGYWQDGIGQTVLVQATRRAEAEQRASELGIYWGGVASGQDCECCGDRWGCAWDVDDVAERAEEALEWSYDVTVYPLGVDGPIHLYHRDA